VKTAEPPLSVPVNVCSLGRPGSTVKLTVPVGVPLLDVTVTVTVAVAPENTLGALIVVVVLEADE
jgi:hypothetical protein